MFIAVKKSQHTLLRASKTFFFICRIPRERGRAWAKNRLADAKHRVVVTSIAVRVAAAKTAARRAVTRCLLRRPMAMLRTPTPRCLEIPRRQLRQGTRSTSSSSWAMPTRSKARRRKTTRACKGARIILRKLTPTRPPLSHQAWCPLKAASSRDPSRT